MRPARRQHRASNRRPAPATSSGLRACLAALYSEAPITPERAAALQRELAAVPYRKARQGELELRTGESDA